MTMFRLLNHDLAFRHIMSIGIMKGAVLVLVAVATFLSRGNFLCLDLCSSLKHLWLRIELAKLASCFCLCWELSVQ